MGGESLLAHVDRVLSVRSGNRNAHGIGRGQETDAPLHPQHHHIVHQAGDACHKIAPGAATYQESAAFLTRFVAGDDPEIEGSGTALVAHHAVQMDLKIFLPGRITVVPGHGCHCPMPFRLGERFPVTSWA